MTAHNRQIAHPTVETALRTMDAVVAMADAAADCPHGIRIGTLEWLIDFHRHGAPAPAFLGQVMKEARCWAETAARAELKAYAAACWERMGEADRKAFIEHLLKGDGDA